MKGRGGPRKHSVIAREGVHVSRKYRCLKERVRFEDGREADREVVRHTGAAIILPELPDGRIVLVEVFRHAAGGWLLEVPAGTLERDEAPEACAARELEEETGHRAGALRFLGSWYPSPGILDETMHLYHATGLVPTAAHLDEDEFLETRVVTRAEAAAMVRDGRIVDGKTLLALFLGGIIAAAPAGNA